MRVRVSSDARSYSTVAETSIPHLATPFSGKIPNERPAEEGGELLAGKYAGPELAFSSPLAGFTGKVSKTLSSPGWPLLHLYFNCALKLHFFSPHMGEGPTELISKMALIEQTSSGPPC